MKLGKNASINLLTILIFLQQNPYISQASMVKLNFADPFVERPDRLGKLLPHAPFLEVYFD